MLGIYVAGDSGGFLNPAITFTNCLYRGLPWKRFPIYLIAQFLGGMLGSAVVYANYYGAIDNFEGKGIRTAPPAPTVSGGSKNGAAHLASFDWRWMGVYILAGVLLVL